METELSNVVTATGDYNNVPVTITSDASVVTMLEGLTITKSADKTVWADGYLTYTITVKNDSTETYANATITDILDTSLVTFKDGSVTIDGTQATSSEYSYTSGTLTVNLGDVSPSGEKVVTFQVSKTA